MIGKYEACSRTKFALVQFLVLKVMEHLREKQHLP